MPFSFAMGLLEPTVFGKGVGTQPGLIDSF